MVSDASEYTHAHDLLLILRTTQSLMADHARYITGGRSMRILDLAILGAIADLEQIEESPPGSTAQDRGST